MTDQTITPPAEAPITPPAVTASPPASSTASPPSDTATTGTTSDPSSAEAQAAAQAAADAAAQPDPADFVPTGDATYNLTLPEGLEQWIPDAAADPAIKALAEHYKAEGLPQRTLDNALGALKVLADKGMIPPPLNFAAETAALTENGVDGRARQTGLETHLRALHERKELSDGELSELMSLVPTANGVRALEKLTKTMTDTTAKLPGAGDQPTGQDAAIAKAKELRRDSRYETDAKFRKEADAAWRSAYEQQS